MDADEGNRTFGAYMGRILSLIVLALLVILTVWFLVQVFSDDSGDVAEEGTATTAETATSEAAGSEGQSAAGGGDASDNSGNLTTPTTGAVNGEVAESGQTLSTNTDQLPDTGAGDILWVLPVGLIAYAGFNYFEARKQS